MKNASSKYSKYKFSAPHVFSGELIITYKNGFLHQIEGIKYFGNKWDNLCINKVVPFREQDIFQTIEEHAQRIYYKPLRGRMVYTESAPGGLRVSGSI
jgi:hypothetical protein